LAFALVFEVPIPAPSCVQVVVCDWDDLILVAMMDLDLPSRRIDRHAMSNLESYLWSHMPSSRDDLLEKTALIRAPDTGDERELWVNSPEPTELQLKPAYRIVARLPKYAKIPHREYCELLDKCVATPCHVEFAVDSGDSGVESDEG
jgi:hypothetical protein